jgi:hypothetical protein
MRINPIISLIALLITAPGVAQRDDVNKMAVMLGRNETSMTVGRVRYDLVGADTPDLSDPESLLLRVARASENGWYVRVYGHEGILVMTGSYSDEALTIAEGMFTFYHMNGVVESTGLFHLGAKVGVWKRYNERGDPLLDRIYNERDPDVEVMKVCGWTMSCRP